MMLAPTSKNKSGRRGESVVSIEVISRFFDSSQPVYP